MDKKIILAGAAGAMAIAGAAIAQTTAQDQNANPPVNSATPYNQNDTTTNSTANPSTSATTAEQSNQADQSAATASQYGQESAATSADESAVNTAGERG